MNSSDTPLGTLQKQRKKQEQTQSPYLLLSGSNRHEIGYVMRARAFSTLRSACFFIAERRCKKSDRAAVKRIFIRARI